MKRYWYLLLAGAWWLAGCSKVESAEDKPVAGTDVPKVIFEAPTIENGDLSTRISLVENEGSPGFLWESTDTVGIFPGSGSQVYFSMSEGAGTKQAIFDGGAWALRGSSAYYSYYPFVGNMYLEVGKIPVDFTGQCQVGMPAFQDARIYLSSEGTTAGNGSLRFSYVMVNTLVRVNATLPAGTYTKASLTVSEPLFVKEGSYNLASPSIVGDRFAKSIEIELRDFAVPASSTVPIYFSLAPVDLQGKTVTVRVESEDGRSLVCTKTPSRAYEAGKWYELHCSFTDLYPVPVIAQQAVPLWPSIAQIPQYRDDQFAATAEEAAAPGFVAAANRMPYIRWYAPPSAPNGTCAVLITGEDYNHCPETSGVMEKWVEQLTGRGVQCIALVYRTPRNPQHFCVSAWQDAQRAIRFIRFGARNLQDLHIDENKIGVVSVGAGSHLALMLASHAHESCYSAVDGTDNIPCTINWAIIHSPKYSTTDSQGMEGAGRDGYGPDVFLDPMFSFLAGVPPICLLHGQDDPNTPMASTKVYRRLRAYTVNGTASPIPAELHLYRDKDQVADGFDRGLEFLTQMGFLGTLAPEVNILDRYASDADRSGYRVENIWPSVAQTPDFQAAQTTPYIEWHFPRVKKSRAIQIIYSCGSYMASSTEGFDVASTRRYLNAKGVTVVTLNYRVPRPANLAKHVSAWQDLQRTIRLVRSEAAQYDLDPDRIGIMGSSAGGHLTVMGVTSSRHPAYAPIDDIDLLSCKVQWGIACCPAYVLTDGLDDVPNSSGGNADSAILAPEFSFDLDTAPMLLIHGDADAYASMNSVKIWEKLTMMGIPAELHTLATRPHQFQRSGSPGTGSYTWLDRIGEFVEPYVY